MNQINITGNITKDPELRKTTAGVSVVSGTLAVPRAFKQNGEKLTDFIDFVAWDKKADYLADYARKGDRLEISGRLESRTYQDRDGQDKKVWEVIVENVTSFANPNNKKLEEALEDLDPTNDANKFDDDLPF